MTDSASDASSARLRVTDFDYPLPQHAIAQVPAEPRRLLAEPILSRWRPVGGIRPGASLSGSP
jgi:hypothetical protein